MNEIWKNSLPEPRRRLVELMQRLNFGCIHGLVIRNGDPVLDVPHRPRVVQEVKFCADNAPRPEGDVPDFRLKAQVIEMFAHFDRVRNGVIESLSVKNGLPFGMHFEAAA